MAYDRDHYPSTTAPAEQANIAPATGAGSAAAQVIPPTAGGGNRPVPATASVTGDTPVFQAYKHN